MKRYLALGMTTILFGGYLALPTFGETRTMVVGAQVATATPQATCTPVPTSTPFAGGTIPGETTVTSTLNVDRIIAPGTAGDNTLGPTTFTDVVALTRDMSDGDKVLFDASQATNWDASDFILGITIGGVTYGYTFGGHYDTMTIEPIIPGGADIGSTDKPYRAAYISEGGEVSGTLTFMDFPPHLRDDALVQDPEDITDKGYVDGKVANPGDVSTTGSVHVQEDVTATRLTIQGSASLPDGTSIGGGSGQINVGTVSSTGPFYGLTYWAPLYHASYRSNWLDTVIYGQFATAVNFAGGSYEVVANARQEWRYNGQTAYIYGEMVGMPGAGSEPIYLVGMRQSVWTAGVDDYITSGWIGTCSTAISGQVSATTWTDDCANAGGFQTVDVAWAPVRVDNQEVHTVNIQWSNDSVQTPSDVDTFKTMFKYRIGY